ncbi:MAG: carboxymuconolactone decarboxylase family protein [Pseudonocardia sp.]|nr:carboxymuconolactone decarboxylase family protein [Pseudonocardia sp.]
MRALAEDHSDLDHHSDLLVGPDQAPLLARPYYASGDPGPIVAALAQVPELLETAMPFLGAALGPSGIDWRTKEIVIVRTSALAGCRYCVQAHTVVALDAGLSLDEVRALRTDIAVADAFTDPRELALLDWVDVVAGSGPVTDDARAAVRRRWAGHEVVELTALVGATLLLNRFATALALPTGPDTTARLATEGLS